MYYEIKQCRPRLEKLKYLLNEDLYSGPENEMNPSDEPEGISTLLCRVSFCLYNLLLCQVCAIDF